MQDDDDFPELAALKDAERARHRRLVWAVFAGACALIATGLLALLQAWSSKNTGLLLFGGMLVAIGLVLVVRGALSALTDIDTRPRHDFDPPSDDGSAP